LAWARSPIFSHYQSTRSFCADQYKSVKTAGENLQISPSFQARPRSIGHAEPRPPPCPLLLPAIGLIAGVALDNIWPFSLKAASGLFLLAVVLGLPGSRTRRHLALSVVLACVVLGAARHDLALRRWPGDHVARYVTHERVLVTVRGTILDRPLVYTSGEDEPFRVVPPTTRTRFTLAVEALIDGAGKEHPASGRAIVYAAGALLAIGPGDRVEVFGWLGRHQGPSNPGEYDRRRAFERRGLLVALSSNTAEAVQVVERARDNPARFRAAMAGVRRWVTARLLDGVGGPDEQVGTMLEAMVLGQRSRVDRALNDAFVRTGNGHLLAVSGLHVGWLALLAWIVGLAARLSYRGVALLVMITVTGYALLAEPNPPILRAAVMTDLACLAVLRRTRLNTLNWLSAAAILLLLVDPCALFSVGFQLSFVVILGIVTLARSLDAGVRRVVAAVRRDALPDDMRTSSDDGQGPFLPSSGGLLWTLIRANFAVAVAAWLAGAPLALWHFGFISPWGWLAAFALFPLAFLVMVTGFCKLALAAVFPSSAVVTAPALEHTASWLQFAVEWMARVPHVAITPPQVPGWWVAACYAALAALIFGDRLYTAATRYGRPVLVVVLLFLSAWAVVPGVRASPHRADRLRVWTLAVGAGTATVIELPDGRTLLYDAGTRLPFDAGAQTLVPFFRWRGLTRIDAAFISHPDMDHYSAMTVLAEHVPIERVLINEHFEPLSRPGSAPLRMLDQLRGLVVRVETMSAGWRLENTDSDLTIVAVWPPAADTTIVDDNDSSTVLRIAWRGRTMLLTGDILGWPMDELVDRGEARCDVLSLPHHGGVVVRSTEEFIRAADPSICIRSSGQRDEDTYNGLLEFVDGREYYNTADDGCVSVTWTPTELIVEAFRDRSE
jgi:competence protein ComEC